MPLTDAQKVEYAAQLGIDGFVYQAADAVGLRPEEIRYARREDNNFEAACVEALERFAEGIEREVYDRAMNGTPEPVFCKGLPTGKFVIKYNNNLLLKEAASRIARYRASDVGRGGSDGGDSGGVLVIDQEVAEADWTAETPGPA